MAASAHPRVAVDTPLPLPQVAPAAPPPSRSARRRAARRRAARQALDDAATARLADAAAPASSPSRTITASGGAAGEAEVASGADTQKPALPGTPATGGAATGHKSGTFANGGHGAPAQGVPGKGKRKRSQRKRAKKGGGQGAQADSGGVGVERDRARGSGGAEADARGVHGGADAPPRSTRPKREPPRAARAAPLWSLLPLELVSLVVRPVALPDLHSLRLAGAGASDPALHAHLGSLMRARVREFRALYTCMKNEDDMRLFGEFLKSSVDRLFDIPGLGVAGAGLGVSGGARLSSVTGAGSASAGGTPGATAAHGIVSKAKRNRLRRRAREAVGDTQPTAVRCGEPVDCAWPPTPVQLARRSELSTGLLSARGAAALAHNMASLRSLTVEPEAGPVGDARAQADSLGHLAASGAALERLCVRGLCVAALPRSLDVGLGALHTLDLVRMDRLTRLPDGLARLRLLRLRCCPLLATLPDALLSALNAHASTHGLHGGLRVSECRQLEGFIGERVRGGELAALSTHVFTRWV